MYEKLVTDTFVRKFYQTPDKVYKAPGRINVIGEHTDYNQGFVLPAAIDKAMYFAISIAPEMEMRCRLYAQDLDQSFTFDLFDFEPSPLGWPNFIMGVVRQLQKRGFKVPAFDLVFGGDIPVGAGLSSSAALESGIAYALNDMMGWGLDRMQLALIGQAAEHEFAGNLCGIMDQFASLHGKENQVIQLDCRSLEYEYFPIELNGYKLILLDSQIKHELADTEYNKRREECEEGVRILQQYDPNVASLRDVSLDLLKAHKAEFPPLVFNRCQYVIEENQRVIKACDAMLHGNLLALGKQIFSSHVGLQYLYEVSCKELDLLVDLTKRNFNVLGARMMGGGFGGCTINLVYGEHVEEFSQTMKEAYHAETGIELDVIPVNVGDGVREAEMVVSE